MSQPPEDFERQYGLNGIAGKYKFPEDVGLCRSAIQERIWAHTAFGADGNLAEQVRRFGRSIGRKQIDAEQIKSDPRMAEAFEHFCDEDRRSEVSIIFEKLAKANPEEISKIRFDRNDFCQVLDVIHGVVSGINPSDINYYLHGPEGAAPDAGCSPEQERQRRYAETRVLKHLGIDDRKTVGWIASEETLERIWEQMRSQSAHRPADSRRPSPTNPR